MLRSSFIACLLLAPAFALRAADDPVGDADRRAVRAVVEAQLKALAAERAVEAFSYATPAIRSQFGDAAHFIAMVHMSYPMLINPAAVSFFQPAWRDGMVIQGVQFRDADGRLWRAVYQLQRQQDGQFRIGGCAVAPDRESSTS